MGERLADQGSVEWSPVHRRELPHGRRGLLSKQERIDLVARSLLGHEDRGGAGSGGCPGACLTAISSADTARR